jgi:hypothetical protein
MVWRVLIRELSSVEGVYLRMTLSPKTRLITLYLLLAAGALAPLFLRTVKAGLFALHPGQEPYEMFLSRIESLNSSLPADADVGYVADEQRFDPRGLIPEARFRLMQYALAPRLVHQSTDYPLVILDSDDEFSEPHPVRQPGWRLLQDLGDGIRVYQTRPGE